MLLLTLQLVFFALSFLDLLVCPGFFGNFVSPVNHGVLSICRFLNYLPLSDYNT